MSKNIFIDLYIHVNKYIYDCVSICLHGVILHIRARAHTHAHAYTYIYHHHGIAPASRTFSTLSLHSFLSSIASSRFSKLYLVSAQIG